MSDRVGTRAVVLGASIAGLFAARVLADAYAEVVVVDRDELAGEGEARRGVPQGRHVHGLLARGQQVLEELLPGCTADLVAAGLRTGDIGSQIRWFFNGRRLRPANTGLMVVGGYRPLLEHQVRQRVLAIPNVTSLTGTDIVAPVLAPDGRRVTGVRVQRRTGDDAGRVLEADLVVDATGRASRTPAWLEGTGYPRPAEDRIKVDLTYATRRFRLRRDPWHGDVSINPVATPSHPRGAFLTTLGGDRAILSLTGILGDRPPTDPDGFLAYARSLPVPDVYDAVRDAEPLDDAVSFHFPASVRRRYERLPRFPERLLVIGDAVCSFNPVYGQGMTVAGLQALALRRQLRRGEPPQPRRFFAEVAKAIAAPWDIAAGGDLAFPGVAGRRTAKIRMGNAYLARLHAAATSDAALTEAFIRVAGLVDPPESIMRPSVALRVLLPRGGEAEAAGRNEEPDEPARRAA